MPRLIRSRIFSGDASGCCRLRYASLSLKHRSISSIVLARLSSFIDDFLVTEFDLDAINNEMDLLGIFKKNIGNRAGMAVNHFLDG
jgi:hypothetical protein